MKSLCSCHSKERAGLRNQSVVQPLERSAVEGTKAAHPGPLFWELSALLSLYGEKCYRGLEVVVLLSCLCFLPPSLLLHSTQTGPKPSSSGWQSWFLFQRLNPAQIWINDGVPLQPQIHMLGIDSHLDSPY